MGDAFNITIKTVDGRELNKTLNAYLDEIHTQLHNSAYGGVMSRTPDAVVGLQLGVKQWGVDMIEKLATLQNNLYMNCACECDYFEEKQIYVNRNRKWIQVDSIQTYEFRYQMECQPKKEEAKKLTGDALTAEFEKFFAVPRIVQ